MLKFTSISEQNSNIAQLILSKKEEFSWASGFDQSTLDGISKADKADAPHHIFFHNGQLVAIQFVKDKKDTARKREDIRRASCLILEQLHHYKVEKLAIINHIDNDDKNFIADAIEGIVLGSYQFLKYFKDKDKRQYKLTEIQVLDSDLSADDLQRIRFRLEGTYIARDLINEPQSFLGASQFSREIKKYGKEAGFDVVVYKQKWLKKNKLGGILAVNKGSFTPARFNVLKWNPAEATNSKPIVLIGKGIVYDTGGLSLKPTKNSMDFMKADMGGAAIVVGIMHTLAKLNIPLNVISLIPSTDNRPGKEAYAPGDVVTMYDGSTVEVLNTDAEGRMVLADALHYAKKLEPELVMDFATLTGAAAHALAGQAICLMGNASKEIKDRLLDSGQSKHERLLEFPMWEEYGEMIKSDIADIKNVGGPGAGMITAGKFLEHFTDYPWLHFDVAGTSFLQAPDSYRGKNGTGVGVRLITHFLENYGK